ncbi:hypothetical protein BJV78DRAFT_1151283 [Lactifluus subvellereus]|nr:hypothetical protein BJV78DRAFT_1151283 [Lactifluus subvellereus]
MVDVDVRTSWIQLDPNWDAFSHVRTKVSLRGHGDRNRVHLRGYSRERVSCNGLAVLGNRVLDLEPWSSRGDVKYHGTNYCSLKLLMSCGFLAKFLLRGSETPMSHMSDLLRAFLVLGLSFPHEPCIDERRNRREDLKHTAHTLRPLNGANYVRSALHHYNGSPAAFSICQGDNIGREMTKRSILSLNEVGVGVGLSLPGGEERWKSLGIIRPQKQQKKTRSFHANLRRICGVRN